MNWLDLLIVGIIAWTTFRALSSGLIREAISLLSLVAGITLSGALYDNLSTNLEFIIADPTTRSLAAFAAIFAGTAIAGQVIGVALRAAAALLFLGPLDRIGGAVFGLAKGLLLVQILLLAVSVFPAQATLTQAIGDSTLAPIFLRFTPLLKAALPPEFQDPAGRLRETPLGTMEGLVPGLPSLKP